MNVLMEVMANQGSELVAAMNNMQEIAERQNNAPQEISRTMSFYFGNDDRPRHATKPTPSPKKKKLRRREDFSSDPSDRLNKYNITF